MIKMNFTHWGNNWWHQQQKKKEEAAIKAEEPDICAFCGIELEEDDIYWIGFDSHMIYAEVCNHRYCRQWLQWKARRKKT